MIEISPAILTNDKTEFTRLLGAYADAGFHSIDIDIADGEFVPHATLALKEVIDQTSDFPQINFGWHLMLGEPEAEVEHIIKFYQKSAKPFRIYIHQEAKTAFLKDLDLVAHNIAVAVKDETDLRELGYYNKFPEVQPMTVISGSQGGRFESGAITKVAELRDAGYVGKISLDGGVNLNTARHIREYDLNRVSVGSYFQESTDLDLDWHKLNLALNL